MKTVITMTSWTKRIQFVAKAIYRFMTTQTIKPDIFYLWLAEEEFPKKENDLPEDLLLTCKFFDIRLCWTKENEYCHKRWYVYPEHYLDLVISIDDDQIYDKDLIKDAKNIDYKENVSFNVFKSITINMIFNGSGIEYKREYKNDNSPSLITNCNGCHIFPPKTFPLSAIDSTVIDVRKKICKKCDESWFLPFIKYNNGKITFLNDKSKLDILKDGSNILPMHKEMSIIVNGNKKRDIQLYFVLRTFPKLMESWKRIFPKYNTTKYDLLSNDKLIKMLS